MSTQAAPSALANEHEHLNSRFDATKSGANQILFVQPGEPGSQSQFLDYVLAEHTIAKRELRQIQETLRSLAPGFLKVRRTFSRFTGNKADSLIRQASSSSVLAGAFNALIMICGFVFFKTRLAGLFAYITHDDECGLAESAGAQSQCPQPELVKEIASSGLFDSHYYLSQSPSARNYPHGPIAHYIQSGRELNPHRLFDVRHFFAANAGLSPCQAVPPLLQYIRSTGREAYSPHPLFDARYYMDSNPDLEPVSHKINPLIHYLTDGKRQGRNPHPLFFNGFYMNQYGEQVRASSMSPLEHFVLWGCTGNFQPNELFDCQYYLSQHPYLKATFTNPLLHYVVADESSRACPHHLFDKDFYLSQVPDKEIARKNPLIHFLHSDLGKTSSPHPLFDVEFYLEEYPHIAKEKYHAFIHFMRLGEHAGYNPNKFFYTDWFKARNAKVLHEHVNSLEYYVKLPVHERSTPHPFFDPDFYISQNEDLKGCAIDPLTHYLLYGRQRGCPPSKEPTFSRSITENPDFADTPLDAAYRQLMELAREPFSCLLLIPGLVKGGAERAACNYIQYLQERHGKEQILILSTVYEEHTAMDWLPEGSRFIDVVKLSDSLEWHDIGFLAAAFIIAKRPGITHIVNSYNFLHAMSQHRDTLENCSRYVVYLFGYDAYVPDGPAPITGAMLGKSACWADCLVTDNQKMVALARQYLQERDLPGKVTACCYNASQSVDHLLNTHRTASLNRKKGILWASRLVETKRPDLLIEIARKLPHLQFMVYGSAETGAGSESEDYESQLKQTPNIKFLGEYAGFGSIDLADIAVFLYTSSSDGIPIVLLEAAACALPIIAPKIGGIPEFVSEETGWLVERFDDTDTYCRYIEECLANPQIAAERAENAKSLVRKRHSQKAVRERLGQLKEFF